MLFPEEEHTSGSFSVIHTVQGASLRAGQTPKYSNHLVEEKKTIRYLTLCQNSVTPIDLDVRLFCNCGPASRSLTLRLEPVPLHTATVAHPSGTI